jgi:hypothetical protein
LWFVLCLRNWMWLSLVWNFGVGWIHLFEGFLNTPPFISYTSSLPLFT